MIRTNTNATWNMYNTYRLEMTLTVLDLIAIFQIMTQKNIQ